jgi:hypothetical protein
MFWSELHQIKAFLSADEIEDIIRWLEVIILIKYKWQVIGFTCESINLKRYLAMIIFLKYQ